jgi:hypothetical protein
MFTLTVALTTSWPVGAMGKQGSLGEKLGETRVGNALEMAIMGRAKRFIQDLACQKVVEAIWTYVGSAWLVFVAH